MNMIELIPLYAIALTLFVLTLATRGRHRKPSKTHQSKSRGVRAMIMEPGKLTEHDLGPIDDMKLGITHNGKPLKLTKDEAMRKIFTEKNWRGKPKRYCIFGRLNGTKMFELMGLEEFNPYRAISAEEADIMVHEGVTMRGARNLVTKVKGVGGSNRLFIFVIILVAVVAVAYMKAQGMI